MRRGEVLGLRWRDIDLDAGRVAVVQTLVGDRQLSGPKTGSGRRNVALDAETTAALREHCKRQLEERLAWGPAYRDEHGGLTFTREDGSPIWPRTFSRAFCRSRAGRRTTADPPTRSSPHSRSLALQAGVHPKVVQERLGHANVGITIDTYSHAIPAMQEDAAATVAALIE